MPLRAYALALLACFILAEAGAQEIGARAVQPFNYHGVRIEGGLAREQLDQVREYYLAIPDDDLLKGFRARAGLPAPGNDLGGWYSHDVFHVFGQIVSGLSRLYAATGDEAFRTKANHLVHEWGACIGPDGYFFFSKTPFARHYIYDKTLWGLLDNYAYCGNGEATNYLRRITDWAEKNLDRSRKPNDTANEWYTLSENLYRAWLLTGDPRYREFAKVWEYPAYWDCYANHRDIFSPRPDGSSNTEYHAYSHVNNLGGAAMAWLVSGNPKYLATVTNAFEYLVREQLFATGGYGPDEKLLPKRERLNRLDLTPNTFETQCGTWAGFKLCKYLISFTGDAKYGDWIERLMINALAATIPMTTNGRVFYYADYCPHGASKRNSDIPWSCCSGTRPQAVADLTDLIYFKDKDGLYVNLYTPSSVRWEHKARAVTLTQRTDFPASDTVTFKLGLSKPDRFQIKFRAPGWLAGPMETSVNGHKSKLTPDAHRWVALNQIWHDGDEISLRLPMKLWTSAANRTNGLPLAVLFGPTVLAFETRNPSHAWEVEPATLAGSLEPVAGKPLHFTVANQPEVTAQPFYSVAEGKPYRLYLVPESGWRVPHALLAYTGQWTVPGPHHVSNEPGSTAKFEFEGTGFVWHGNRYDDAGRAEVTVDGKVYCVVDQYGPGRDLPFEWKCRGLPLGLHTVAFKVLEEKTAASTNRYFNISGVEVLGGR